MKTYIVSWRVSKDSSLYSYLIVANDLDHANYMWDRFIKNGLNAEEKEAWDKAVEAETAYERADADRLSNLYMEIAYKSFTGDPDAEKLEKELEAEKLQRDSYILWKDGNPDNREPGCYKLS